MWWRRAWFSLKGKAGIPGQTEGCPATSIGPRVLPVGSLQQRDSTGLTLMSVELNGKRLELLREVLPTLRRTAVIANPDHRGEHLERRETEEAAQRLGITIQYL